MKPQKLGCFLPSKEGSSLQSQSEKTLSTVLYVRVSSLSISKLGWYCRSNVTRKNVIQNCSSSKIKQFLCFLLGFKFFQFLQRFFGFETLYCFPTRKNSEV